MVAVPEAFKVLFQYGVSLRNSWPIFSATGGLVQVPSYFAAASKTRFDIIVALVPLCLTVLTALIAAYVALVSRRQAKTANRKLSLDLYDRRFQIYMRAVDLYQALLSWSTTSNIDGIHNKFIRAKLESTFLFPNHAGVRKLLVEMDRKAMLIIGFSENAASMAKSDPAYFAEWRKRKEEAVSWFDGALTELEKGMVRSMRFHETMDPW